MGGWDSQQTKLRGHATGHYLSALAQVYASTGYDTSLRANFAGKMEYMVNTLYELSQLSGKPKTTGGEYVSDPIAVPPGPGKTVFNSDLSAKGIRTDYWNWGKGFISAYPPDQFIMLEKGAGYGGDTTKIRAPYYTLHKILAGLIDVYEVSGNIKALETVKGMGDWVYARLSQLPTTTLISMWNRYIAGEFGGKNEAMARLYRITNESRYLKTAQLFDNIKVFFVKINGKKEKVKAAPGTYLTLSRDWKDGDTVELRMPFQFYLEPVMDQQNIASLFWGPVLLAAQEPEPQKEWRKVTLNANDISKSITGDAEQLQFNIDGVVFKPFYETYGRYSVYLDVVLK